MEQLSAANFTSEGEVPEHTYQVAGIYQITIKIFNGEETYFRTTGISLPKFDDVLISIDSPIPKMKGVQKKYGSSPSEWSDNSFKYAFLNCKKLVSICEKLLFYNPDCTNVASMFSACKSLTLVPADLFDYTPNLTDVSYVFADCPNLGDFVFHIPSRDIASVGSFVAKKAGTTRTIYVPSGSTTETTFNAVASGLGLTIIGE